MLTRNPLSTIITRRKFFTTSLLLLTLTLLPLVAYTQRMAGRVGGGGAPKALVCEFEAVQTQLLNDGNVLERKTSGTYFRDNHGRVRREQGAMVTITDPVAGIGFLLDTVNKTARKFPVLSRKDAADQQFRREMPAEASGANHKLALGKQKIDGWELDGTELVNTIRAGSKLGNRDPINIVLQVWNSEELQMPLLITVKHPLAGERTQRYRNIQTGVKLDPRLFQIPDSFTVIESSRAAR